MCDLTTLENMLVKVSSTYKVSNVTGELNVLRLQIVTVTLHDIFTCLQYPRFPF